MARLAVFTDAGERGADTSAVQRRATKGVIQSRPQLAGVLREARIVA